MQARLFFGKGFEQIACIVLADSVEDDEEADLAETITLHKHLADELHCGTSFISHWADNGERGGTEQNGWMLRHLGLIGFY